MAELAGQPSSSQSILLTYGPTTGEQTVVTEAVMREDNDELLKSSMVLYEVALLAF